MKLGRTLKKIGFNPTNARKLLRGVASQFKPEQLKGEIGEIAQIALKSPVAKKIEKAIMGGKMCRLCLSDFDVDEIDGEGFKDFLRGVSRGAKKVGKAVGKAGKAIIKPLGKIGKAALKTGLENVLEEMPVVSQAVDFARNLQGGAMPMVMVPLETWSTMIGPMNAAFNPPQPSKGYGEIGSYIPPSKEKSMAGGSFRVL